MKRISCLVFPLVLSCAVACSDTTSSQGKGGDAATESSGLAIKTVIDCQIESVCDLITENDQDFVDDGIYLAMSKSPCYQRHPSTKGESLGGDTLLAEQVPSCEAVSQELDIYEDGHAEMVMTKQMGPEGNPAVALCESPVDMSLYVSKITVKDGMQRCYNADGCLLYEEAAQQVDYTTFLSALKDIMGQVESEAGAETKSGVRRDANWLREKMESHSTSTKSSGTVGMAYTVTELPNGNVLLEQSMNVGTKAGMELQTSKIEFSPDITRVEKSESWVNSVLRVSKEYSYDIKDSKLKSNYAPIVGMSEYNPRTVTTKKVVYLHDGTPMIKSVTESYKRNQSYYYFNK